MNSLDAFARDLASGRISRRRALRGMAGVAFAATMPSFVAPAWASAKKCPKHHHRCGKHCCPPHSECHHGDCKCKHGLHLCKNKCVNFDVDIKNCGHCGTECAPAETCQKGKCKPGKTCLSQGDCDPLNVEGDCKQIDCTGHGICTESAYDLDRDTTPTGNPCTYNNCHNGVGTVDNVPDGSYCPRAPSGGFCVGGACVECYIDDNCPSGQTCDGATGACS